ncbi:hypothetical protein [Pelagicoccus albus]|uniref:Uncharacterized protein n=1 Tax=Pelagicoccus albus TaxID=415222 RepID=A0A7X1B366_9BACT|nr:hypothetical protein [Pelagicoccus albus]MBC2604793.1 hypothetical protein [Pelagicoccus albus]
MKRKTIIPLGLLAITSIFLLPQSESQTTNLSLGSPSLSELEQRLIALEEKVTKLESENESLQSVISELASSLPSPSNAWSKREFNGETFYVTPALSE